PFCRPGSRWARVFVAASPRAVKMRVRIDVQFESFGRASRRQAPKWDDKVVGRSERSIFLAGDLFDQVDNAAAQLRFLDPHESLGESETLGGGEEVRHIGRRGGFFQAVAVDCR